MGKTKYEIIFKISSKTAENVVNKINAGLSIVYAVFSSFIFFFLLGVSIDLLIFSLPNA